jgi:glycosyltransferase involved in cell wall biosynthesis
MAPSPGESDCMVFSKNQSSKCVFLWENVGPTHADRLAALAAFDADREVVAIQYSPRSHTYLWTEIASEGYETRTLFPDERVRSTRLALRLLRACWREGRATFFLCHYQEWPVLIAATVLRLAGRRVFTMVDSKFDDYSRWLPREVVKAVFLLPYLGALTASLRSRDYLRFLGIPPDRIMLGYDTLSIDRIATLAQAPIAPDGTAFAERDFLVIARHVQKKNVAMAIDAFAIWLGQAVQPRDLHLCGSGPLEDDLRIQVTRLGLTGRVHFHGFIQTDAVSRLLAGTLCLLLPSVEEQFGLVVVEAQALGVPVIVSANAGASDILVDCGLNGFLLDPGKPESCAALMLLLSEDELRWRRFAEATCKRRYRGDSRHFVTAVRTLADN